MKRRRSILTRRHRKALQRAGIAVTTVAIVVIGFNGRQRNDTGSAPAEGSLIVNVNTATREQIGTVPGVGALRAMQIISNPLRHGR